MDNNEKKLDSLKPKFAPTIPTKRTKKPSETTNSTPSNDKPQRARKAKTNQHAPQQVTASGPFALGPSQPKGKGRTIITPSGSSSFVSSKVKSENDKPKQLYSASGPGGEESEDENEFIFTESDSPFVITKKSKVLNASNVQEMFLQHPEEHPEGGNDKVKLEPGTVGNRDTALCLQLPPQLPLHVELSNMQVTNIKNEIQQIDTPMEYLTNGRQAKNQKIGKLVLYKSGRMVLRMGNVDFDVSSLPLIGCAQHVGFINNANHGVLAMPCGLQRIICTPSVV